MTKLVKIMLIVAGVLLLAGTVAGIWIGVEAHSKADDIATDVGTLRTDVGTKAEASAVAAALASKADKTAVDALKVTVDKKASAFAVRSLTKRVKALECDLVDGTEGCVAAASSSSTVEVRVK